MIDRATVTQILDTANIVDVVSDFVSLHRRGANYVGLCPFHNEKTPSFVVSPSKGLCHCFGCGKGGSAVNFIMEHEQISYYEALKYLANKYHIEVHEREMTDAEREKQSERESMLVINEFASGFFESQLHDTDEGRNIGLAYFRERGFSDETIRKFHLGYSPEKSTALYSAATAKGYNKKFLFEVGLCIDDKRGGGFDRFRGRVMFPIFNVAGKVIAFGGRVLKKVPNVGKYFNSPESAIYVKNRELYGLYQAKRAIVNEQKCFLVEGYTDVISMHQAGIENVVASSGTSLTEGQIRMIHRFTDNVTILYDGDSAGIHASLRGINMLLAEGLNIKVLLLPDGEDPDSFARSHSAAEFKQYIAEHETDFIRFKTRILLENAHNDPIKLSAVVQDVVRSIAVIPSQITRAVYAKECSGTFNIPEDVLLASIADAIRSGQAEDLKRRQREQRRAEGAQQVQRQTQQVQQQSQPAGNVPPSQPATTQQQLLFPQEKELIRYVVKYGMCYICGLEADDGTKLPVTVTEYVRNELDADDMRFSNRVYDLIYEKALQEVNPFYDELNRIVDEQNRNGDEAFSRLTRCAARSGSLDIDEVDKMESQLRARINERIARRVNEFRRLYLEKVLCSSENDEIRETSWNLANDEQPLSKIHTQFATIVTDEQRLFTLLPKAINGWKNAMIECRIVDLNDKLKTAASEDDVLSIMQHLSQLYSQRSALAKEIGERVVNPVIR